MKSTLIRLNVNMWDAAVSLGTWARFSVVMRSSLGGMGERPTLRVASKVAFTLFLAFDFVTVAMENPRSQK